MAEKDVILTGITVSYTGLFNYADLYRLIDAWLIERGYDCKEGKHTETVTPDGKSIEVSLEPTKGLADYARCILKVKIAASKLKDVTITLDGTKQKINSGTVTVTIDGLLETDYEGRWEGRPMFVFFKILYDKYIFKTFTGGFEKLIKHDVESLRDQIKGYLNLERVRTPA